MSDNRNTSASVDKKFKPKFQPKLKVENTSNEHIKQVQPPTSNRVQFKPRPQIPGRGRDGYVGRGFDGRDNSSRGRGRAIAPIGTAFFRGNASQSGVPKFMMSVGNFDGRNTNSESRLKSDREDSMSSLDANRLKYRELSNMDINEDEDMKNPQSDDDDDDDDKPRHNDRTGQHEAKDEEVWPPSDTNPLAPIELPVGPSTEAARKAFDSKSIFAAPEDRAGIEQEETVDMFLMQLPSDLRLPRKVSAPSKPSDEVIIIDKKYAPPPPKPPLSPGKIGTIQMMRSGKVHLIDLQGRRYSVSPGMTCTFAQYAASISLDPVTPVPESASTADAPPASTSTTSTTSSIKIKKEGSSNRPPQATATTEPGSDAKGTCHFLGSITRKIIVVPEFDLGTQHVDAASPLDQGSRSRSSAVTARVTVQGMKKESLKDEMKVHHSE